MNKLMLSVATLALFGCAAPEAERAASVPSAETQAAAEEVEMARTIIYAPQPTFQPRRYAPQQPRPVYRAPAQPAPQPVYRPPQPARPVPAPTYVAPQYAPQPAPQYVAPQYAPQPAQPVYAAPPQRAPSNAPRLNPRRAVAAPAPRAPVPYTPAPQTPRAQDAVSVSLNQSTRGGLGLDTSQLYRSGGAAGDPVPPRIEYNIAHLPQEEPLWCWAAAAQQAIGWVNGGRAPAQCAIVAMAHNLSVEECCADREGICAKTGEIPAIAQLVRRFGGTAVEIAVPRNPRVMYEQLNQGKTMLIRIRPAPHDQAVGIRHMIVVRGIEWLRLPNGRLEATLLYNDPLGEDQRQVAFNEIVDFFEQAMLLGRS